MATSIKRKQFRATEARNHETGFREAVAYLQGVADAAAAFNERGDDLALAPSVDHRGGSRMIDLESADPALGSLDLPEPVETVTETRRLTLFYGQEITAQAGPEKAPSLLPNTPQRGGARLFEIGTRGFLTLAPCSQRVTMPCDAQTSATSSNASASPEGNMASDIVPRDARDSGVRLHVPRLAGEWYELAGTGTWGSWGSTG